MCGYELTEKKMTELIQYFRLILPEFRTLSDEMFKMFANRSVLYIPSYVFKNCCWNVHKEIICNFVAHWIMLFAILENGNNPQVVDLTRTASSLSEDGLSASFADVQPTNTAPHVLYDWLTRTAYGEMVKMLMEKCLSSARGVFCV